MLDIQTTLRWRQTRECEPDSELQALLQGHGVTYAFFMLIATVKQTSNGNLRRDSTAAEATESLAMSVAFPYNKFLQQVARIHFGWALAR